MRSRWLVFVPAAFLGCAPSPQDEAKIREVKAYLLKVVEAQKLYKEANETYSLNIKELFHFDSSLSEFPGGYRIKGGGGLAMAFSYQVEAIPETSGPHFYVNDSGVVRYSLRGRADGDSRPVD